MRKGWQEEGEMRWKRLRVGGQGKLRVGDGKRRSGGEGKAGREAGPLIYHGNCRGNVASLMTIWKDLTS